MLHSTRGEPGKLGFVVFTEGAEIVVERKGSSGESLGSYRGRSVPELKETLLREGAVSAVGHAIDLGVGLGRAESKVRVPEASGAGSQERERFLKEGITQTDNQRRLYPKVLSEAGIDSMIA